MKKYNRQNRLIHRYALIISKHTGIPHDCDEVQDSALEIYIAVHGKAQRLIP